MQGSDTGHRGSASAFLELPGDLLQGAENSLERLALGGFSLRGVPPDAAWFAGLRSLSLSLATPTSPTTGSGPCSPAAPRSSPSASGAAASLRRSRRRREAAGPGARAMPGRARATRHRARARVGGLPRRHHPRRRCVGVHFGAGPAGRIPFSPRHRRFRRRPARVRLLRVLELRGACPHLDPLLRWLAGICVPHRCSEPTRAAAAHGLPRRRGRRSHRHLVRVC
ncbi:hypothetical protein U9M48_020293 [Paspalum notatum var. saurae]|uniref:Uncharacterized protein n=1 Tax=Paspalum notatum var. saurae TaxID=547442 RepID=A0AAQ3THQ8_PASNO